MKTKHELLLQAAKQAINDLFSDQSVDRSTTRDSIHELQDELIILLDALAADEGKDLGKN